MHLENHLENADQQFTSPLTEMSDADRVKVWKELLEQWHRLKLLLEKARFLNTDVIELPVLCGCNARTIKRIGGGNMECPPDQATLESFKRGMRNMKLEVGRIMIEQGKFLLGISQKEI